MNIINRINTNYDDMTKSYKNIANYIKLNYQYILYDTLNELAYKTSVSTTTIVRFSKYLGYDGYSQMQSALREYATQNNPYDLGKRLSSTYNPSRTNLELLNTTFDNDMQNMIKTLNHLNLTDLKKTIDILTNANHIFVTGFNDSFILASYMALRLGQIRNGITLLNQLGGMYPFELNNAKEGDVIISYLFPRYSNHTINVINILKKHGCKSIVITSNNPMPLKDIGDIILETYVSGLYVKDSLVAPIFLSNFIANSIAYSNFDNALVHLNLAEDILSKGYYLSSIE